MKLLPLFTGIILIITSISTAEIIWSWDLTELPTGWTADPEWWFDSAGAHCFCEQQRDASKERSRHPFSDYSDQTSLTSNVLTIPDSIGACDLTISFYHDFVGDGGVYDQAMWVWIEGRAILNDSTYYAYEYYELIYPPVHQWGYREVEDSGTKTVTIEYVQPEDELIIEFFFECEWWGANAFYQMNWDVTDLVVEADATPVDSRSWAEIKSIPW